MTWRKRSRRRLLERDCPDVRRGTVAVFAETAARKGLAEAIVEKDFWVCWTLHQLFSIDALAGRLLFKGGTSLSKIFHAINRFSEDIDLAVDYVALGFTGNNDPRREDISRNRRNNILDEMMTACQNYIGGEFLTALRARWKEILGALEAWDLNISAADPNTIEFRYPAASTKNLDYVRPQVVLELGTHAEFVPHDHFTIRPYVAEEFPKLVEEGDVGVIALLAKRTFWEKATILHAQYHRAPEKRDTRPVFASLLRCGHAGRRANPRGGPCRHGSVGAGCEA